MRNRLLLRDIINQYIPDAEEQEEFAAWAFGEKYLELSHPIKFMENWNLLHGDKLKLEPYGVVGFDAPLMVQAWRDSKCE